MFIKKICLQGSNGSDTCIVGNLRQGGAKYSAEGRGRPLAPPPRILAVSATEDMVVTESCDKYYTLPTYQINSLKARIILFFLFTNSE